MSRKAAIAVLAIAGMMTPGVGVGAAVANVHEPSPPALAGGVRPPIVPEITRQTHLIAENPECSPVKIFAFRGSGQPNVNPSVTTHDGAPYRYSGSDLITNGWEGGLFVTLLNSYVKQKYDDGFRTDHVPVIGVGPPGDRKKGYPAIPGTLWSAVGDGLVRSAEEGAAAAEEEIHRIKSLGCRTPTKFIAIGYSQGAMATRLLLQLDGGINVHGVINVGDPFQKPYAPGNEGEGLGGNGLFRAKAKLPLVGGGTSKIDQFYSIGGYKSALCHYNDPICDFKFSRNVFELWNMKQHVNYLTDAFPYEAGEKAKDLADLAHDLYISASRLRQERNNSEEELEAKITVSTLATVGRPATVSAVSSTIPNRGSSHFAFDLDGDGVFETSSDSGVIQTTFEQAGERTVSVRVTDSTGRSAVATTSVSVAPADALKPLFDVTDSSTSVSVSVGNPESAVPGSTVPLTVRGVPVDEVVATKLVSDSAEQSFDPWSAEPVSKDQPVRQIDGVRLPATLTPGKTYILLVLTESGQHGCAKFTVPAADVNSGGGESLVRLLLSRHGVWMVPNSGQLGPP